MSAPVLWREVVEHPQLLTMDAHGGVPLLRRERVGDAAAHGHDLVLVDMAGYTPMWKSEGVVGEVVIELIEDESVITHATQRGVFRYGHARVERVGEHSEIFVRTPEGEYRAEVSLPGTFPHADFVALHAHLYQRAELVRETALQLPRMAGALGGMVSAGRTVAGRAEALARRIRTSEKPTTAGRLVTVEVITPKVRSTTLKLKRADAVFPEFRERTARPVGALAELVGEALAQRLPARAFQAVLAGMAHVVRAGSVELEEDERLPKAFRLAVMDTIGMPSRSASKAQRDLVTGALEFLTHAEMEVRPVKLRRGERAEYLPLLVRQGYREHPDEAQRSASRLALNAALIPDMERGAIWRVPEALFQVPDESDREGVTRLVGYQLAYRLGMGTTGHEALEKMLRRAGVWEWAKRTNAMQRGTYVLDQLRGALDQLRALPHAGHAPADIVGGTVIVGDSIDRARVEYRTPPRWVHSSA